MESHRDDSMNSLGWILGTGISWEVEETWWRRRMIEIIPPIVSSVHVGHSHLTCQKFDMQSSYDQELARSLFVGQ
jgi:hypothetical protein